MLKDHVKKNNWLTGLILLGGIILLGFCIYITFQDDDAVVHQKKITPIQTISSQEFENHNQCTVEPEPVTPEKLHPPHQNQSHSPPQFKNKKAKFNEAILKVKGLKEQEIDLTFNPMKYIENFDFLNSEALQTEKSFFELIGLETEKKVLNNFIQSVRTPSELINYNVDPLKGVIFYGVPGNGKTTLARAFAKETGFQYIEIDGTIFQKFNQKEGIEMVEALFFWIQKYAPVVVCIDECEIPFKHLNKTTDQNMKNIVTKFKNSWTDLKYQPDKPIFFIGTTNHLEEIDPAMLSRFDYKIAVKNFNLAARKEFLQKYATTQLIYRDVLKTEVKIQPTALEYLNIIAEELEAYPSLQSIRQLKALFRQAAILAITRYYENPTQEENKIIIKDLQQTLESNLIEAKTQNTYN
ncbi:ATP-binding protein [Candidatus Phytoplasma prunorum]|uniref:ATP-binding protein n=1 Tax=Candidatus Phytoplasma prunorum TaxID=47565 RepID=UPI002FF2852B